MKKFCNYCFAFLLFFSQKDESESKLYCYVSLKPYKPMACNSVSPACLPQDRVAEVGSLSASAKMAIKVFVRRVFAIFATNANLIQYNICAIYTMQ